MLSPRASAYAENLTGGSHTGQWSEGTLGGHSASATTPPGPLCTSERLRRAVKLFVEGF